MATRAADGQCHPHGRRGFDTIDDPFDAPFFRDQSTLAVLPVVSVEAGSDLLIERCVGEQITCQLLDRELVERHVAAKGVQHPISPAMHVALVVRLKAVAIGVARAV